MQALSWAAAGGIVLHAFLSIGGQTRIGGAPQADHRLAQQQNQQEDEKLLAHIAALVGQLTPEAEKTFQTWERAVLAWQKEPESGVGAKLASGVLYDCLTRLHNVWPPALSDHKDILVWAIPEKREKQAIEALRSALRLDPDNPEARFRLDRLLAPKVRSATMDLQRLAADASTTPFDYLAAMTLAEIASSTKDPQSAERWYERAVALFPRSTAARIALSALRPSAEKPFVTELHEDPFYEYPCRVMTPAVSVALSQRLRTEGLK